MSGYGFESWVSFAEESTWGTAPGSGEIYARLIDESMKKTPTPKFRAGLAGPGRRAKYLGFTRVSGDVQIETLFQGVPALLLKHAFGSVITTGTGPYTHTYAMATALPTGLNMEVSKADVPTGKVFRYDGCLIDALTLNFAAEDELRMVATILAKEQVDDATASGTPSYSTDEPILFHHAGQLTVAGSAVDIKSGSIRLSNTLDRDRFFMSQTLSRPKRKSWRDVTGNATIEFEDLTLVDKFVAGTEGAMSLAFTSGTNSLTFSMTASFLQDASPIVNREGQIEMDVQFQAIGGNTEAACVLISDQATIP